MFQLDNHIVICKPSYPIVATGTLILRKNKKRHPISLFKDYTFILTGKKDEKEKQQTILVYIQVWHKYPEFKNKIIRKRGNKKHLI